MKIIKKVIRVGKSKAITLSKDLINGKNIEVGSLVEIDFNSIKRVEDKK